MPNASPWMRSVAVAMAALLLFSLPAAANAAADPYVLEYQWRQAPWELDDDARYNNIESGDFDGDGRTDSVAQVGGGYNSRTLFFFQRPDGQQPVPVAYVMTPITPFHFRVGTTVADVDRDGRSELLLSTSQGLVIVWVGADRTMRTTSFIADDRMAHGPPVVVDVDNDGHLDVVQGEASKYGTRPSELVIRYGDGRGGFGISRYSPTGEFRYGRFEAGDMNGDGRADLVGLITTQSPASSSRVGILYGDGRGGFHQPDISLSPLAFEQVLVGDMNSDGRDDAMLIVPTLNDSVVSGDMRVGHLYHQGADGTLPAKPVRVAMVERSKGYDLEDMDGDGRPDLVTVSDKFFGRAGVHLQRDGVFTHVREFEMPYTRRSALDAPNFYRDSQAYGDFNGDGVRDIVYSGGYGPYVMLAGRKLSYATNVSPPGPPRSVTATGVDELTEMSINFLPPLSDGGSPITHYQVVAGPDTGIYDEAFADDPLRRPRGVIGQINGERYRYRVRAYNAAGPGPLSEPSPEVQVRRLPVLSVTTNSYFEPSSGVQDYRFELSLDEPALEGGVSFDVATKDGTALAGLDYQAVVRRGVQIPAGSLSAFVDVPVFADNLAENQEYFYLEVSNVSGAKHSGQRLTAILSDPIRQPTIPTVQVLAPSVLEGNTGLTVMRFPILMSLVSATDVSFDIRTQDGTAQAGLDYAAKSMRLVIPAGQTASHFDVAVLTDLVDEVDETLSVFVDGLVGAGVSSPTHTGTILDDDSPLDGIPEPIGVASEKGYTDLEFVLLYATDARFSGTALVAPAYRQVLLGADPTPGLPLDGLASGVTWASVPVPANPTPSAVEVRLLAIAQSSTSQQVSLLVGEGSVPSPATTTCTKGVSGRSQVCELVLRREPGAPASTYWMVAQNTVPGPTGVDTVELEGAAVAIVPVNRELFASAQAILTGAPFTARVGWDIPSLAPGERRLGYVLVESAPGQLIYQEPVRLHRTGALDAPHVLAPGVARDVRLAAGDAQERLVFDVPVNAVSVTFTIQGAGEASLYASHAPQPSSPTIVPAPPRAQADAVSSLPGASQSITLSGTQLRKGRWYVTPMNRGSTAANLSVRADVVRAGARPAFRPGHYFNPSRPGHGLFVDFAGDQWVMVWYTYLQDGTPTWYYTQGPAPAEDNAQWPVDLLRVSRGQDLTRAVSVGSATLSILEGPAGASPKIAFGYNLDGDAGWETLSRLGDDTCPMYAGQKLDATGHWFAPADPGYGFSAQILPNTEIYAAYIYEASGFPRWLIGQKDYDPAKERVTMQQLSGFCPTCPLVPLQSKSVSTLERTLGSNSSNDGRAGITSLELYTTFEEPVSGGAFAAGAFSASAPVFMLSARKGCD